VAHKPKRAPQLASDRQLRDLLTKFYPAAEAAACSSSEEFVQAFNDALKNGSGGARLVRGIAFKMSDEVSSLKSLIVQRCLHLLGPQLGHEKELADALWESAATWIQQEDRGSPESIFLASIQDETAAARLYYAPNCLVRVKNPSHHLTIGPVAAMHGETAAARLLGRLSNPRFSTGVGGGTISFSTDGSVRVGLPEVCWEVQTNAAKGHVTEEATWLVQIAVSLLRITASQTFERGVPTWGAIEVHPISPSVSAEGLRVDDASISPASTDSPDLYHVSGATVAVTRTEAFRAVASAVFDPPRGAIAERVAQGLGWLARGRQSADRSERMLFFFTALEALLSGDDGKTPVVQTVSRHVASILNDNPAERAKTSRTVRELYSVRSALVHAGTRRVSITDATTVHALAETVFWRVLSKVDLATSRQEFHAELEACSFGLPWRPDQPDLLPIAAS